MKHISELRQDLVSGDWVLIATGRARRPNEFARRPVRGEVEAKAGCPFERLLPSARLVYDRAGVAHKSVAKNRSSLVREWWVQVVPNKYPAFGHGACALERTVGPYRWQDGVGFHEVVISRDHTRSIAEMSVPEVSSLIRAYRDRYLALKEDECVQYISIFHNHGRAAGATISHPHSQIIAVPVIPPDVARSIRGSAIYFGNNRECVHCRMLRYELEDGRRIIHENQDFVALCPFVSRSAFEVRIFPLRHEPDFETIADPAIRSLAGALRTALAKLSRGLARPAYNFFIHTTPASVVGAARYYHWHVEIIPKTAVWAGFEIGTGIEISTISPEAAAAFLRRIKV